MEVGFYINQIDPYIGGGHSLEQTILSNISIYKNVSRHNFFIISDFKNKELAEFCSKNSLQYIWLFRSSYIGRFHKLRTRAYQVFLNKIGVLSKFLFISKIDRILGENRIELVISFSPRVLSFNYPYFITVWDLAHLTKPYFPEVSKFGTWESRERFYLNALRQSAKILVGTEQGKKEIITFYGISASKVAVCPFPISDLILEDKFENIDVRAKYDLKDKYVLYPAQFWPHKNHYGLVKAFKKVIPNFNSGLILVLVGTDKGNLSYIRKIIAEEKLENKIKILGFIPIDDLCNLYKNAEVLAYVSLFGPDNLPPIEAFALECPVIAHDTKGSREQLGDAAYLVNTSDESELSEALLKILMHKDLSSELRMKGQKIAKKITVERYHENLFQLIDTFMAERRCWDSTYKE